MGEWGENVLELLSGKTDWDLKIMTLHPGLWPLN